MKSILFLFLLALPYLSSAQKTSWKQLKWGMDTNAIQKIFNRKKIDLRTKSNYYGISSVCKIGTRYFYFSYTDAGLLNEISSSKSFDADKQSSFKSAIAHYKRLFSSKYGAPIYRSKNERSIIFKWQSKHSFIYLERNHKRRIIEEFGQKGAYYVLIRYEPKIRLEEDILNED
jgi:hypothetical protein